MGINFYIDVCLLLSKWLCVMGYSREILKLKARATAADSATVTGTGVGVRVGNGSNIMSDIS